MSDPIKLGFEMSGITLALDRILPARQISEEQRKSTVYARIKKTIEREGLVEHLMVYPVADGMGSPTQYLLVDGHVRFDILKSLGYKEAFCLLSKDDESYSYNHKVNGVAPIQQHFMILRAIEHGVSEEEIAETLSVDVAAIRLRRNMIKDICPEAVELLKDKQITPLALGLLKKVKPLRQIEMAELMIGVNNYSKTYVEALLAATSRDSFVSPTPNKEALGLKPEDLARMEKEMESLEQDFRAIENAYGVNVLNLVLARGYLVKILDHAKVVQFLAAHHAEILREFQSLIDAVSLEQ